jgi:hypothetical protein
MTARMLIHATATRATSALRITTNRLCTTHATVDLDDKTAISMSLMVLIVANASPFGRIQLVACSNHEHCYPGHAIVFLAVNNRKQSAKSGWVHFCGHSTRPRFGRPTEHVRPSPDHRLRTRIRTRRPRNSRIRKLAPGPRS